MALASVSVYELSRLSAFAPQSDTVKRRSSSTKGRRKYELAEREKEGHTNNNKTIPPLGRQKSPGQNHSVIRQRQHSPAGSKNKTIPTALSLPTIDKKKGLPKKYLPRTSSRWSVCITVVNEIGTVANKNIKNIRHLKLAVSRGMETYDEEVVLTATRLLSRCNGWSLDTCHDYLPTIIENITSIDRRNRFIALEGLGAISSGMVDKLEKFSTEFAHRTEGNSLAEEKAEKAKICIQRFRSLVNKCNMYYRRLDGESIDKLGATMELLKKI